MTLTSLLLFLNEETRKWMTNKSPRMVLILVAGGLLLGGGGCGVMNQNNMPKG